MQNPHRRSPGEPPQRPRTGNEDPPRQQPIEPRHKGVRRKRQSANQLSFDFGPQPVSPQAVGVAPRETIAELVLFPLALRRALILKLSKEVTQASTSAAGENLLRGRLARIARGLRRKRVSEQTIASELRALETAVRTELWSIHLLGRSDG